MNIKHLRYFKAVADHKSFTKAATALHIAQPAISMAIKSLETSLDLTLLHRNERHIHLTDEGARLYEHATKILQATEDALLEMRELRGLLKGEVRVGIPSMLGSYYFPPILMAFRHRYPQLTLTVIDGGTSRLRQLLETGELDLAVIVDNAIPSDLDSRLFLKEQMMVVCSREHAFATEASIAPEQLFAEELVMFNTGYFHRNVVDNLAQQSSLTPNICFETNLTPLIKSIVKQGFAVTTLMKMVIEQDPELIALPFTDPIWLDLSIAWRKDGYLSQANQTFVDFVVENSLVKT